MKKSIVAIAIISMSVSLFLFAPTIRADGPGDAPQSEPKLTPALAQTAIVDLIRAKSSAILKELDADEWARKEIKDEGKGTWSLGGLFYFTPKDAKYAFTIFPKPGVAACAIMYDGKFKIEAGKWVAQSPEIKAYAMMPGK